MDSEEHDDTGFFFAEMEQHHDRTSAFTPSQLQTRCYLIMRTELIRRRSRMVQATVALGMTDPTAEAQVVKRIGRGET